MGRREEYIRNLNVTRDDIQKMEYAHDDIYDYISGLKSYDRFVEALGPASTILGLIFIKSTATGVAAAVAGLLSGMLDSEKQALKDAVQRGSRGLRDVKRVIDQSSQNIERVSVDFPFLKFIDEGFSIVQGGGLIKGYLINGDWSYID